jgi:hypothetical protein
MASYDKMTKGFLSLWEEIIMKKIRILVVAALIAVTLVAVTAPASALTGYGFEFSDAAWETPCGSYTGGGGYLGFNVTAAVPKGYLVKNWLHLDEAGGVTYDNAAEWSDGSFYSGHWGAPIADDGYFHLVYQVYSPGGILITQSDVYGSCPSGEARTTINDIGLSIQQPAADQRASGYVLSDTPLYSQADPGTVRSETLKAGQTWFVVGSKTGTDGNLWYEMFVGGVNTAYVPAASISITEGAIP